MLNCVKNRCIYYENDSAALSAEVISRGMVRGEIFSQYLISSRKNHNHKGNKTDKAGNQQGLNDKSVLKTVVVDVTCYY